MADATGEAGKARQQAHAWLLDERRDLDAQMKEFRLAGQDDWLQTRESVQKALDDLSARVDRMWNALTGD